MKVFAENSKRDIYANSRNQIAFLTESEAVAQLVKSSIELQAGELIYNTSKGMPTDATVWSGTPNLLQFDFFAKKQIRSVNGVESIISFKSEIVGDKVRYETTVKTIYGQELIIGSV